MITYSNNNNNNDTNNINDDDDDDDGDDDDDDDDDEIERRVQFESVYSLTQAHVPKAQSCADDMEYIRRVSHATFRVPRDARDSSAIDFDRVEIKSYLQIYFSG